MEGIHLLKVVGTAEKVDKAAVELSKAVQMQEGKVVRMPEQKEVDLKGNLDLEQEGTQNSPEGKADQNLPEGKVDLQEKIVSLLRDKVLLDYCYLLLDKVLDSQDMEDYWTF